MNRMPFLIRDGRIKLYGKDNTQAHLESKDAVPSKFLQVLLDFLFLPVLLFHIKI